LESGIVLNSAVFSEHWSRNLVATCHFFHPVSVFRTETALWPSKNRNWDFTAPLTKLAESQYCMMSLQQATFLFVRGGQWGGPERCYIVTASEIFDIEATAYDVFRLGAVSSTGVYAATSSLRVEDMLVSHWIGGAGSARALNRSFLLTAAARFDTFQCPTCSCSARVVYVAAAPDSECSARVSSDPKFTPAFPCKTTPRVFEF
jgi:hypothetical protein